MCLEWPASFMPFMTLLPHSVKQFFKSYVAPWSVVLLGLMWYVPSYAEKADQNKALNIVADHQGVFDLLKHVVVFSGNVIITKGSITIKADRVEVHETPDGHRTAIAVGGGSTRMVNFRQKREGVDEYIEGRADRLEYEEKADVVRFVNNAVVQRLRGTEPADEITGNLIVYNNITEIFSVSGGTKNTKASGTDGSGGRVRAVLSPRNISSSSDQAASQPLMPLRISPTLGDKR